MEASDKAKIIFIGCSMHYNIGDDIETLHLLRKAGCRILFIGLESIDQKNLTHVNKKYSAAAYEDKIKNIIKRE